MKHDFYSEKPVGEELWSEATKNFNGESRGIHPWLEQTKGFTPKEKDKIQRDFINFDSLWRESNE